jgi:hypothetical protein
MTIDHLGSVTTEGAKEVDPTFTRGGR